MTSEFAVISARRGKPAFAFANEHTRGLGASPQDGRNTMLEYALPIGILIIVVALVIYKLAKK